MSYEKPSGETQGETGVEQGATLPTTENLKEQMAALKAKVEAAKLRKGADAEKKVTERESLIGEAKGNVELLSQANETLDYFTTMQELGDLDAADTQKLEELKALVVSLEQKRDEIDQKIETISKASEVLDKIQDAATRENAQRELKQLEETFHGEFDPKIDKLIEEYNLLLKDPRKNAERDRYGTEDEMDKSNSKITGAVSRVRDRFEAIDTRATIIFNEIDIAWRQSNNAAGFYNKIAAMRSEAGMFDGKKKAILDAVLEKIKPIVSEYVQAKKKYDDIKEQAGGYNAERNRIKTALTELMSETGTVDDKYEELMGGSSQRYNTFAKAAFDRFNKGVEGPGFTPLEADSLHSMIYRREEEKK